MTRAARDLKFLTAEISSRLSYLLPINILTIALICTITMIHLYLTTVMYYGHRTITQDQEGNKPIKIALFTSLIPLLDRDIYYKQLCILITDNFRTN